MRQSTPQLNVSSKAFNINSGERRGSARLAAKQLLRIEKAAAAVCYHALAVCDFYTNRLFHVFPVDKLERRT